MIKIDTLTQKFFGEGAIFHSKKKLLPSRISKTEVIKVFKKKGCVLFRNFDFNPKNYKTFIDKFTQIYANDTNDFERRESTTISRHVRHVDKGHEKMSLHSEASFSPSWPQIVWFYCNVPSKNKGETTICDGIELWEILSSHTKKFFLSNPLKFYLKIPVLDPKKNGKTKAWDVKKLGAYDGKLDYKKGILKIKQLRFAVNQCRFLDKLSFANHVLHKEPYIDKTIEKWGTIFDKKIPKKIINEVEKKAELLTYYHKWKKNDLLMIDNMRFMHARNFFNNSEKRVILNSQTLKSKFN